MSDDKKYPGIKKFFAKFRKEKPSPKSVYAGPEYFRRMKRDNLTGKVYAGPEQYGRKRDADIEEVYAGPEYFERRNEKTDPDPAEKDDIIFEEETEPIECVYAGPEYFAPPEPETAPVYAGPEYFNTKEFEDDVAPLAEGVYAGPAVPQEMQGPNPSQFMMVYGGPDYFANRRQTGFLGFTPENSAQSEKKPDEDKTPGTACPMCGSELIPGARFCNECGTPVSREEKKQDV